MGFKSRVVRRGEHDAAGVPSERRLMRALLALGRGKKKRAATRAYLQYKAAQRDKDAVAELRAKLRLADILRCR